MRVQRGATKDLARRAGFSFVSTLAAGAAGVALAVTILFVLLPGVPSSWRLASIPVTAVLVATSVWLARLSQISRWWLSWPLVVAAMVGFVGFWAWVGSAWDPEDEGLLEGLFGG